MNPGIHVRHTPRTLRDEIHGDINFGRLYPVWSRFVLPGDTWRVSSNLLIRFQPMVAPPLTRSDVRVRFAFVPLRLVEEDAEFVITGSKDGHYDKDLVVPHFNSIGDDLRNYFADDAGVGAQTGSLLDWIYGIPVGVNVLSVRRSSSTPAAYWLKAFCRFLFDYYRDENFCPYDQFKDFYVACLRGCWVKDLGVGYSSFNANSQFFANLRKDGYVTSALPWQLKGIAPTITPVVSGSAVWSDSVRAAAGNTSSSFPNVKVDPATSVVQPPFEIEDSSVAQTFNKRFLRMLNDNTLSVSGVGFNMAQFREMVAQTRVFERLARTGSRYTEYLQANFGTAPRDDTLQRAQYLGGYKIPIVTTEVLQTGEGDNPVGTMRGHGITSGGDRIHTFHAKEFGVILAILDVRPQLQWTQGVDREKTYKNRWDFYNPSFQHLSEQEVRNGEVYFAADGLNDGVFGFVPYGQELRVGRTRMAGEMRGNLAYWNQAVVFGSRPNLNQAFLKATNYDSSWTKPFAVQSGANPMVLDFAVTSRVVRPMDRSAGVPGLVDHN